MTYSKHVLQSELWATFRQDWGTKVIHVGNAQFTVHPLPLSKWTIGYMPRPLPDDIDWKLLAEKAKENKCVFIKIEPNSDSFTLPQGFRIKKGERVFATATYVIDLQKSEGELLKSMDIKTRYNVNLAQRKGVVVKVGHDDLMMQEFLDIYHATASRHKILLHDDEYYKLLFKVFHEKDQAEILTAYYNDIPLASMMVLFDGEMAYYPYGGSIIMHREAKAFHLLMWEAFKLAKNKGYPYFDMWNCLPPELEDASHPWYGFHYFKKGFGGKLLGFCGAYDLVFQQSLYYAYIVLEKPRISILKLISGLKR